MQIEAGKYYRTRDGRKAGPMSYKPLEGFDPWEDEILGDLWSDSGKSDTVENDLIAEWTDEPHETPHFTNMLAEMQDLAENYGYTISAVSTNDGPLVVDFTLTN